MEEFTIKALFDDIRNSVGVYLNKSRTDEIIGGLLKKYHILMTDAELLSLVEVREVETNAGIGHSFCLPPHQHERPRDLFQERLNRLAVEDKKTSLTIEELNDRRHHHSTDKYKAISWALK